MATNNVADRPVSGLAIASLVLGILTLLLFWVPFLHLAPALITIVLGMLGLQKVRSGRASGGGLAIAGIICAVLGVIPTFLLLLSIAGLGIFGPQIVETQLESWEESGQFEEFNRQMADNVSSQPRLASYGRQDNDPTKTSLQTPRSHGGFSAFAFSPDGTLVAGGTAVVEVNGQVAGGGEVLLWNANTGKLVKTLGDHGESVCWVAFSRDGNTLASASAPVGSPTEVADSQSVVKLWDLKKRKLIRSIQLDGPCAESGSLPLLLLTPDGNTLVSVIGKAEKIGSQTHIEPGDMVAWNTQEGNKKWSVADSSVRAMTLSANAEMLIGCVQKMEWREEGGGLKGTTRDSRIAYWDMNTGKVVRELDAGKFDPKALLALPDDQHLVGLDAFSIALFDTQSGEAQVITSENMSGDSFRLSADGTVMAIGDTRRLVLLELPTGKILDEKTADFQNGWWDTSFSTDLMRIACTHQFQPTLIALDWTPQSTSAAETAETSEVASLATEGNEQQKEALERQPLTNLDSPKTPKEMMHTWTDNTGKHTVEAEFVSVAGEQVTLKRADGKVVSLPMRRLSERDRNYVESLQR